MATSKISHHITKSLTKKLIPIVLVLIDRLQLLAWPRGDRLREIPGFSVERDTFVRQQTSIKAYRRVRIYRSLRAKTSIYVQYDPACTWLAPIKITVIADDDKGIRRPELEKIVRAFWKTKFITVEIAFDFSHSSGVDRDYVLRHGIFGKARLVGDRHFIDLRYGTRHSETLVRAYDKVETNFFRVEAELHSAWLRKFGITQCHDLLRLSQLLFPSRIRFVAIDWDAIADYLQRRGQSTSALNRVRSQTQSIHRALSLLRTEIGLVNVHRFLISLPINELIHKRLRAWGTWWRNSSSTPTSGDFYD